MNNPLVEGMDYYYDLQGLMVLTQTYHLSRGFCCAQGCLHCPYHYEQVPEPARSYLLARREKGPGHQDEPREPTP